MSILPPTIAPPCAVAVRAAAASIVCLRRVTLAAARQHDAGPAIGGLTDRVISPSFPVSFFWRRHACLRCLRPPPWASAPVSPLISSSRRSPRDLVFLSFLLYLSVDETTTTCVSVRQPFHLYHLRDHFMRCMAKILQLLQAPGGIFSGRLVLGAFLELRFFSTISH